MLCLSRREICPRPSGDAESAAISTSRRSCGLKDSRYPMIRVWFFSQSALSRACSASSSAFLRRAASCLSFAFSAFCRFSSPEIDAGVFALISMTASVMGALDRREHLLRINSDAKDRRRSSDLARPRCTPSFSGRDGPTSRRSTQLGLRQFT